MNIRKTSGYLRIVVVIAAIVTLLVVVTVESGGGFRAVFGGPNLWDLKSDLKKHTATAFADVNERLLADYGISFKGAGSGEESCYSSEDPLHGLSDTCGRYLRAEPVTADSAFIEKWRKTSPAFETWLIDDGWQKEWNAAQPIDEILDKPQNDSSIGVNYSKQYGKVSCTLSLTWVQPNEPNQLNAKEECFGSLR